MTGTGRSGVGAILDGIFHVGDFRGELLLNTKQLRTVDKRVDQIAALLARGDYQLLEIFVFSLKNRVVSDFDQSLTSDETLTSNPPCFKPVA